MRKYIIDRVLFALVGLWIILHLPQAYGPIFTVISESIVIVSLGYLCRRLWVLPLDLITGKNEKIVHFCGLVNICEYEFSRKRCCCLWKFQDNNKTFKLLNPVSAEREKILAMKQPPKDRKIKITYFRYSKILCSWELA